MRPPTFRPVSRTLHGPLLVGGRLFPAVERRLFFAAIGLALLAFYVAGIVPGAVTFVLGYALAWGTRRDPYWLVAHLRTFGLWTIYDAGKHEPFEVDVCD